MSKQDDKNSDRQTAATNRLCVITLLIAAIGLGAGWRLTGITQWPSSYHMTRQYDGALLARTFWLRNRFEPLTAAEQQWFDAQRQPIIELPLLETLVATVYVLTGQEVPWVAGLLNTFFWLAGGWFVFDTARRLSGDVYGGVVALSYYLLAPLGIALSRSFQPEALMIFGFVVALWAVVRAGSPMSWRTTIVTGLICGVAMLVKPGPAFFPLLGAYLAIAIQGNGVRKALSSGKTFAFLALLVLPSMLYGAIALQGHVGKKVLPHLLLQFAFYRQWWVQINACVGWFLCAAAIAGAWLLVHRHRSYVGFGLLLGYVVFCMTFTWHTMTHSYYHAILIVIVAICLGPWARLLHESLRSMCLPAWQTSIGLVLLIVSMAYLASAAAPLISRQPNYQQAIEFYEELGGTCGHGTSVIYLGEHYGNPLRFHGWLLTRSWPKQVDKTYERVRRGTVQTDADRLERMLRRKGPRFFVVTNLNELRSQPELSRLLGERYKVFAAGPTAVIYDLTQPKG